MNGTGTRRQFIPQAARLSSRAAFVLLVNPANPLAATLSKDLQAVADKLGVRLHVLHANTEADFEAAFATAAQLRVAALVIGSADPLFGSHAAQLGAMPVVGYLNSLSADTFAQRLAAFRKGLAEAGYVEGRNVAIEYRWAEGQFNRLPALAADLVARRVNVIVAVGGGPSVIAAKAGTATIPIVFTFGGDPVKAGFVGSFNEPSGNITGVSWFGSNLVAKKLELLLQLVPDAAVVALLLNPNNAEVALQPSEFEQAVSTLGRQFHILNAGSEAEIDSAFAALVERRVGALVEGSDPFLFSRRRQIIALAARHAIPTIHPNRESVADGGLMSYGNSLTEAYRRAGNYAARILKGAKPADLPVERLTRFELVINLKTAKALGLTVPDKLLALADEVIEQPGRG